MKVLKLDGDCLLYAYKLNTAPLSPEEITGKGIPSHIPGNVEIDLMNAGLLPDIYYGANVERTREFELYNWWYVKDFEVENLPRGEDSFLVFDGVDTYAEYFLNNVKIGESDNMLIPHEFRVDSCLKQGKNTLAVHIFSSLKKSEEFEVSPSEVAEWECFESLRARRAAHTYGWDIFPRVISAGIWRSVRLEFRQTVRIESVYLSTLFVKYRDEKNGKDPLVGLAFHYELKLPAEQFRGYHVRLHGQCKGHSFDFSYPVTYKAATKFPYVESPRLWWPNGMGEANLYDVTVSLLDEKENVISEKKLSFGFRHIRLVREDFNDNNGFRFYINALPNPVFCRGANWVPLDVLHSKDRAKYEDAVMNYVESNCNMVRVWGGGVYEDEGFFDLCDRHGITVWQDIMLSCHAYPQDGEFARQLQVEVESFVRRVRNHPSLALYCGSNETDWIYFCTGRNPSDDVLTRKVIPDALKKTDPYRPYYPSTPLFSEGYTSEMGGRFLVDMPEIEASRARLAEEHYWWHRDDYLAYARQKHCFVGEIGYSGAPSLESLNSCMNVAELSAKQEFRSEAWKYHDYSTDGDICHATKFYFGTLPNTVEDFVLSSQISQAEAYKYIVEYTRASKIGRDNGKGMSGILLWNMRDGWPAYNSALVDYYGRKKLAFLFVKQSQQPLAIVMRGRSAVYHGDEHSYTHPYTACICNDTLQEVRGHCRIFEISGTLYNEFAFHVYPNDKCYHDFVKIHPSLDEPIYPKSDFLIFELKTEDGSVIYNHFVRPAKEHNLDEYKQFLEVYLKKLGEKL